MLIDLTIFCYNLIMRLLRARDNNILSFAYIWLHKENQSEFLKHPKIKWLDGGLEPPTSRLPVHCSGAMDAMDRCNTMKQWTGNSEVEGSSPPSNHLIFEFLDA